MKQDSFYDCQNIAMKSGNTWKIAYTSSWKIQKLLYKF